MSTPNGQFVWCELMTTDLPGATAFYRSVIGWNVTDAGMGWPYMIANAGETPVGGLMELPKPVRDGGGQPAWTGYVGVANVDEAAGRLGDAGGSVHKAPDDIPGVGRFAVVGDPQGAVFTLFTPGPGGPPPTPAGATPGRVGWHELWAGDQAAAMSFYADMFGWTKGDAIDMGQMGTYQLFKTGGSEAVGGMMTKTDSMPHPFWLYYFNVDSIDAAVERNRSAGGELKNGPMQVPGGQWIAHCQDPQGAMFAMVAMVR